MAAEDLSQSWLTLLLAGAEQRDLEAWQARQLETAHDDDDRASIALLASQAGQLRLQLAEHRQRAGELAALNDLALRLSGTHDLTALLQDSVTQARRLLDVDVAYLALPEEDRSLTIRVTDGSMGPELRGIRMPPHSGLAGRVLDKGEPMQSVDYLGDSEITHADVLDHAADVEGLRTILGTPLRLRGEVIGVLMVAQREVRSFRQGELTLLSSLAAFAAVAIDNARLIEDYRQAAYELSAANEQLRAQVDTVNRAAGLHDHLLATALRGDGVDDVIVSLSQVLEGVVLYLDDNDRVLTSAYRGDRKSEARVSSIGSQSPSQVFRAPAQRHTRVDEHAVTVPVSSADSYFGALQIQPDGKLAEWDVRMLERAAMTIALIAFVERAVTDAERRTASDLLAQLVTRRVDDATAFIRRARPLGLDIGTGHLVAVCDPRSEDSARALAQVSDFVATKGGLAATVLGHVVAVIRADEDSARDFVTRHRALGTVGLAGPATGLANLADAFDDAAACVTVLHGLERTGSCATPADLGPYRFLLSRAARTDARRFVAATVGPLVKHDAERNTELVRTADEFLTNGRQHAATAAALRIHANTLYQRLERIGALLGEDWRAGDRALDVQMALRIRRLMDSLEASEGLR